MKHAIVKTGLAALVGGGLLAGCATTVDMGVAPAHYRYSYDSRPVVSEGTVVRDRVVSYPAPEVVYRERTYVYPDRERTYTYPAPAATYDSRTPTYDQQARRDEGPTVIYRESRVIERDPSVTYYRPSVVYELHPSPSLPYQDHGQ